MKDNYFLQIFHALFGFVRSPVATTITQVFSRIFVTWFILNKVPSVRYFNLYPNETTFQSRASIGVPMLLIAWSVTEVIRYSFYALNLINAVPHVLVWCR
jgi:very-long-chain (3R)-3-hydroxyacyl-CoA dehydratase